MKQVEISPFGTATIGSVIDILRNVEPEASVMFDFCGTSPTKVASYRGYYDHLALGWTDKYDGVTPWPAVADLLEVLEGALNKRFTGYKGGDYLMDEDTPLWVDNWGDSSGTGIVGVEFLGELTVILQTAKVD